MTANENAQLGAALSRQGIALYAYETLDSTSSEARRRACDVPTPALFLAACQTDGRGRMGRQFFSPANTGLYLSLLMERSDPSGDVGLTAAASVAAVRAIRRVTGIEVRIKWVNDLYRDGKKIGGILCESFAADGKRFVSVGIGINLYTPDGTFPEELRARAGSLFPKAECRYALAQAVATELCALVGALPDRTFMAEYRACSAVLGRTVTFAENGVTQSGIAEAIEDDGALSVRLEDGKIHRLASGEISLRVCDAERTKKEV